MNVNYLQRISAPGLWCLGVAFLVLTSCGPDSCASKDSKPAVKVDESPPALPTSQEARGQLYEQIQAVIRINGVEDREQDLRTWAQAARAEREAKIEDDELPVTRLRRFFDEAVGDKGQEHLRWSGSIDLIDWADQPPEGPQGSPVVRWAALIPVDDVASFLKSVEATPYKSSKEQVSDPGQAPRVLTWMGPRGPVYASPDRAALRPGQASDSGAQLAVSSFPDGARYAVAFLQDLGVESITEFQAYLWPRRAGVPKRYEEMGALFEERLARAGHNLIPGRAALARLQSQLYLTLGAPENWPETVHLLAGIRRRDDGSFRDVRTYAFMPVPEGRGLAGVYDALSTTDLQAAPAPAEALGSIRWHTQPRELEDLLEAVFPQSWQMIVAASGEPQMNVLVNHAKRMLGHSRGAMTLAFYPHEFALTGETFVGWRVMDVEELETSARAFHGALLRSIWMPLFLADASTEKHDEYRSKDRSWTGQRMTFEAPGAAGTPIGVCWTVRDQKYLSYYGAGPCEKLEIAMSGTAEEVSSQLAIDADLAAVLDLVYMPPNRPLRGLFKDLPINLVGVKQPDNVLEWQWVISDESILGALIHDADQLGKYWDSEIVIEPGELLNRLGMEQAIYQEPGLMIVGPPGLLGTVPPAYFLGMPFSMSPAPPDQLREALLGEPQVH